MPLKVARKLPPSKILSLAFLPRWSRFSGVMRVPHKQNRG